MGGESKTRGLRTIRGGGSLPPRTNDTRVRESRVGKGEGLWIGWFERGGRGSQKEGFEMF